MLILLAGTVAFAPSCANDQDGYEGNIGKVASPSFTPQPGSYDSDQVITIHTNTEGASIHYTTNGDSPSFSDPTLNNGEFIALTAGVTTIKAIAYKLNMIDSNIVTATYTIQYNRAGTPLFLLSPGTYDHDLDVEIISLTEDAVIYYTTNGNDPTTSDTVLEEGDAIHLTGEGSNLIKAIAVKTGITNSEVAGAQYIIDYDYISLPSIEILEGTYDGDSFMQMISTSSSSQIYYTSNGNDPTDTSTPYSCILSISENTTYKAVSYKGSEHSAIASTSVTSRVLQPVLSPADGTFIENQNVTITCGTPDATIYYTKNGEPPETSQEVYIYTTPIYVVLNTQFNSVIKAVAVKNGMLDSIVSKAHYRSTGYPKIVSLSPHNSASKLADKVSFTLELLDENGYADVITNRLSFRITGHGTTGLTSDVIMFEYMGGSTFNVFNGSGLDRNLAFGDSGTHEVANCIVDLAMCSVSLNGSSITLCYTFTPTSAFIDGNIGKTKKIWSWVQDSSDHNLVEQIGTWHIDD